MPKLITHRVLLPLAWAWASLALAAPVATPHVQAELVSDRTAFEVGRPVTVAVRLEMERGWHTYWQNPGDSGLPTTITWKLPAGFSAGPIQWPYPERIPVGPLANYGYGGEVLLLTRVQVPASATVGQAGTLRARADWLVCREVCIPDGADLSLTLPYARAGASQSSHWAGAVARAQAMVPQPVSGWDVSATRSAASVDVVLSAARPRPLSEVEFFPLDEGKIEPAGRQVFQPADGGYRLELTPAKQPVGEFRRLRGVLVAGQRWGDGLPRAVLIDVPLAGAAAPPASPASAPPAKPESLPGYAQSRSNLTLPLAILFALVGGLLLNLMPCVFPVLSLKVLGFAQKAGHDRRSARAQGLAFGAGVLASFLVLATLIELLRAGGTQLGWGFQLQSPLMVGGLALLFFVLALNLSGLFEFGTLIPSSVANLQARGAYANAFLSGVLAAVIASPCTAPFMGAALGFALTEPAFAAYLVFGALAIGLATPYFMLAWFPAWLRHLPKPGAWMQRLRELLAFPLYATVVWLLWVIGLQSGIGTAVRLLGLLLAVAFAAWLYAQRGRTWRIAAAVVVVLSPVLAWPPGEVGPQGAQFPADAAQWAPFTPARLAQLSAAGKPVFIDFTAAWCVICQVNKRLVLEKAPVQAAFERAHVTLLRADWTLRDSQVTRALADLGRNGIPVYVLYRPGRAPLLLPELLREKMVFEALDTL